MERFSLRIALVYGAVAAVWILVSDQAVEMLVTPAHQAAAHTVKGWAFVAATAALIYFLTSRELRRRSRVENELRAARAAAERADATKGRFLASMSHELRTPLNAINGYSEMMVRETYGALGNPFYRQHAEIIHASGRHLLALIDDMLDIARLDLNELEIDPQPQRLCVLIDETCRLLRGRAREKGLTLSCDAAGADDWILGDRVRLKQVLLNLVGNAVRYTDAGEVKVGLRRCGDEFVIEVSDTGPGIAPALLTTSRTPFAAHAGRRIESRPRGTGAGLGLPLAHLLIERHGGRIEIDTELGVGSTLRVFLPRLRDGDREDLAAG